MGQAMDNLSGVSVFVQTAETLSFVEAGRVLGISASAVGKSIARLENRLGIACLPDFAVRQALEQQRLQHVLGDQCRHSGSLKILWPSSKHLTPRLRAFIDIMSVRLFSA